MQTLNDFYKQLQGVKMSKSYKTKYYSQLSGKVAVIGMKEIKLMNKTEHKKGIRKFITQDGLIQNQLSMIQVNLEAWHISIMNQNKDNR